MDMYSTSSKINIVFEYYNGEDILHHISSREEFSEKEAASIIKQILEATVCMHKNDIIHKDLKAENILIDAESGKLKIIDFGTAQSQFEASEITADIVYGAPYYNSPEALMAEFSAKNDVWAIGTILYTMLCGFPPFAGVNDKKIMSLIENGEVEYDDTYWRDRSD